MNTFKEQVEQGIKAPLAGIRFIKNYPTLLSYFAVPVLINTLVYSAGAYLFFSSLGPLLHKIFGDPQVWYLKALFIAAGIVFGAVFALILIITFTAVGLVIAGPFLEVISQKVDEIRLGRDPSPESSMVADIVKSLLGQIKKIIFFFLIQGLCLLVYLIPVFGQIGGAAVQLVVSFFFLAWEFWDFPMDRRKMTFAEKKKFLSDYKYTAVAFGAVCFVYILVPLLNFVMMPMSVAGATILISDLMGEKGTEPSEEKMTSEVF